MTKSHPVASSKALPFVALFTFFVLLFVYNANFELLVANVVSGFLLAFTPISIIAGAIFLFKCMEVTGSLDVIKQWLNTISSNKVAELMIIGWAFAFLIEGASGFGTPAAIAAPILYSLGFPALRVAIFCLVMNTIPVSFGAVGTPIWFGFSVIDLTPDELSDVAYRAALINTIAAPIVVFLGLAAVIKDYSLLFRNSIFILLSVFACTIPHLLLSRVSVEFPSLVGGFIGLIITVLLAKYNIGLSKQADNIGLPSTHRFNSKALIKASFPLWGTVLLLVITRIKEFHLKDLLQLTEPNLSLDLGYLGVFQISASLVLSISDIFGQGVNWQHSLLYIPSLLPFIFIGISTLLLYRFKSKSEVFAVTASRLTGPVQALIGALIFVNLMMLGNADSPVSKIGNHLASLSREHWAFFSPFLGALGSFFSGSATISNLTFSGIQVSIAEQLELDKTKILALQSIGASMGNMVCINNIVAVTSILGILGKDGEILKQTFLIMLGYGAIAVAFNMIIT